MILRESMERRWFRDWPRIVKWGLAVVVVAAYLKSTLEKHIWITEGQISDFGSEETSSKRTTQELTSGRREMTLQRLPKAMNRRTNVMIDDR